MATNTNGTSTSISNTPQATDDVFTAAMTGLTDNSLGTVYLSVMANDLGGAAKTLYSIDAGNETTIALEQAALLTQDTARTEALSTDHSDRGAHIWITSDGKVGYDARTLDPAWLSSSYRDLGYATDSFTYAIRLGNGTLSWATAYVEIAPPRPGVTLAHDSGTSSTDNITRDGTLCLSGIAHGATVQYSIDGGAHWNNSFSSAEGMNNLQVRQIDVNGNISSATSVTFALDTGAPAVMWASATQAGIEGSSIALGTLSAAAFGPGNSVASLVVSAIPAGATLSDGAGGHSFTASAGHTAVDVHSWTLGSLTITPSNDANFTLSVQVTDTAGNMSAATEAVTVNPLAPTLAPVAESGVEGAAIALNLGATVNGLAGDGNSLASLVVSAIPVGATLSDGVGGHSFTASAGHSAVDVHGWTLGSLTITPTNDANFTLSVAATATDGEGNLSTTTTATEAVTVNPLAPTLAPVAESGVEGAAIALNLGATVNGLAGDSNGLASLLVGAIPLGATLSDGSHSFTASAGHTAVDVHGWTLGSLTITPTNDANFTLSVAATATDGEGNLSATTTATEAVTVNPLAPTLAPVAESGVEGAAIALNLGATVNGLTGDSNSLASLMVSAIPVGAT
ncbi:Ig-like domain repeat protein, partial [Cupriavidus sp. YAF13]|uniref:Ig-like domain repeat protein n=1 Tax=Cupriavidus sp. YAF13 TaxID=3233075 RepID=UPI003F92F20A